MGTRYLDLQRQTDKCNILVMLVLGVNVGAESSALTESTTVHNRALQGVQTAAPQKRHLLPDRAVLHKRGDFSGNEIAVLNLTGFNLKRALSYRAQAAPPLS